MPDTLGTKIRLPYPHFGQQTVRRQAKRFNWLSAGRRWRKTTLVMAIVVEEAATKGGQYVWGAPTFDQVRIGFDETKRACGNNADFNISRMTVTFPRGGLIYYRSFDDPDNARGLTANGIVMDECGDIKREAWYEVLMPMLIDTDGWAWGIGTPRGYNWFWNEHQGAKSRADSASWEAPTLGVGLVNGELVRRPHPLENPLISFDEIKRLHETLSEKTFHQEILAQFVEMSGGVFRRVMDAATVTEQAQPEPGHQYCFGVDWGKSNDFTVISVLDINRQALVFLDRFNQIDYQVQLGRLRVLYERFQPLAIIAESNSMGQPLIEQLYRQDMPVQPFQTTNATKAQIIDGLSLAFERSDIQILNDPVLIHELQAYEMERLPSGLLRYSAPEGIHDDCVMSLALAWYGGFNTGAEVG